MLVGLQWLHDQDFYIAVHLPNGLMPRKDLTNFKLNYFLWWAVSRCQMYISDTLAMICTAICNRN